jgi:hypothetical protein
MGKELTIILSSTKKWWLTISTTRIEACKIPCYYHWSCTFFIYISCELSRIKFIGVLSLLEDNIDKMVIYIFFIEYIRISHFKVNKWKYQSSNPESNIFTNWIIFTETRWLSLGNFHIFSYILTCIQTIILNEML